MSKECPIFPKRINGCSYIQPARYTRAAGIYATRRARSPSQVFLVRRARANFVVSVSPREGSGRIRSERSSTTQFCIHLNLFSPNRFSESRCTQKEEKEDFIDIGIQRYSSTLSQCFVTVVTISCESLLGQ